MNNESQHEHLNALCIKILIKLLIIRHIFFNAALITKDNNVLKIHVRTFILLFYQLYIITNRFALLSRE